MKKILLVIFLVLIAQSSFSGVNRMNGNFYISITDIIVKSPDFKGLEITRTYNSKSTYEGSFGIGWGNLYDTYLILTPENSVAIKMHGAGGTTFFESELTNEENIQLNISQIILAAKKGNKISSPEEEVKLTNQLTANMSNRLNTYTNYKNEGLIESALHQIGIMYYSLGCGCIGEAKPGYSYVISTDFGYKYFDYQRSKVFSFNKLGKMIGISEMENPDINFRIVYNAHNQLDSVVAMNGQWLSFKIDSNNRVTEVNSAKSSRPATFKYKGKALILSKNTTGYYYHYLYDKVFNMTKIVFNPIRTKNTPEDAKHMIYEPGTYFISKIIERDSSFKTYEYPSVSDDEYGSVYSEYSKDSVLIEQDIEWWFRKANDHGKRWTYKKVNIHNGDSITRVFHEISRKPLLVKNSEGTYNFSYDPTGLLLSAQTPQGSNFVVNYDDNNNMNSVKWKGEVYDLVKDGASYSKIVLPNGKMIKLPLENNKNEEMEDYRDELLEIKNLFDLSYFNVL